MSKRIYGFAIGAAVWPGLSKLIEEAGEVCQVSGKLIATNGQEEHWDGSNLRQRIEDELADLMAACQFVIDHNNLDAEAIKRRADQKLALFAEWHKSKSDNEPANGCRACAENVATGLREHGLVHTC